MRDLCLYHADDERHDQRLGRGVSILARPSVFKIMGISLLMAATLGYRLATLKVVVDKAVMSPGTDAVSVELHIQNVSKRAITVWDPINFEGMNSVRIFARAGTSKWVDCTPPAPPRAGGVATGKRLAPGAKLRLMPVVIKAPRGEKLTQVMAKYQNALEARGAVTGVWTGQIASTACAISLSKPQH